MSEVVELHPSDIDESFASAWDALPPARGAQADIYDSYAWFAAWLSAAPEGTADRVRIAAVVDDAQPVAILPLLRSRSGRRATIAATSNRTRARPIIGTALPSGETLGLLAEGVARSGVRGLDLHRMPSNDPATAGFVQALGDTGFRVVQYERSSDNLTAAGSGWDEYARELKGFAKYAKRFTNRLDSLWNVDVETYGTTPDRSTVDGFDVYNWLHQRSWRSALGPAGRERRVDLLRRAEQHGWARVFVLRVDGTPAAAHIWFRLGDVATWLSTAYDQRLAAFSPGTVVMWQAQSRIFAEGAPLLVDLLPGTTPEKERLTTSRPPLLVTEAVRPSMWSGVAVPSRRHARRVSAAVAGRVRVRRRNASASPNHSRALTTTAIPAQDGGTAHRLELTAAHRRYVATATGDASPEKMAASWPADDEWWATGDDPSALVRIGHGEDGPVAREIIQIDSEVDPVAVVGEVASQLGREIALRNVPVFGAVLPWPQSWGPTRAGGDQ